jgi:flagellar motor switch protein FliN/FliY
MSSSVDKVKVDISVMMGRAKLPMHRLLRMGRGAVIELDARQQDEVLILANDTVVARGEIYVDGEKIGVRVTRMLRGSVE